MTTKFYPKYQINRSFGVSSLADGYEYRRVATGEFDDKSYKSYRLTSASMMRAFNLINLIEGQASFSSNLAKGVVRITRYYKILKVTNAI